ncbi:pseudaminic acid synthase [Elusimicrobiota bacterium]
MKIADKKIGKDCPVFIVAEISANHAGDFNRAVELIEKAKESGADAVKFQAYTPDTMTIDADNRYFKIKHPRWGGQTLYELYKKAYTPWEWFKKLKKTADDTGILFFSTAFDKTSVDFLEDLNVPVHKIASFELVDHPLIKYTAGKKKPMIISTGMGTLSDIRGALKAARGSGARDITLLRCTSSYPAYAQEMNLNTIPDMHKKFKCPIGLSDHSLGNLASIAAVCLGAVIVEKHFTLSRKIKSPDSFFSIEPAEFKDMVKNIRTAEDALGRVYYGMTKTEAESKIFRRSIFAVEDIKKGARINKKNIRSIRPESGLAPKYMEEVLGASARVDIKRGTPLTWKIINKKNKSR